VRSALGRAARDFYGNSWRLVPLNALLGAVLVGAVMAAVAVRALIVLVVLAGPAAAALVHCAVTLVRTGNLAGADAVDGLRLHWKRGLQLGAIGTALAVLATVAVRFYAGEQLAFALGFATIYLALALGLVLAIAAVLAVAEPERRLRDAIRDAAELVVSRPGGALGLGFVLLLVNLLGIAAAVMPFLTLTVAYSFVAVAHFTLEGSE